MTESPDQHGIDDRLPMPSQADEDIQRFIEAMQAQFPNATGSDIKAAMVTALSSAHFCLGTSELTAKVTEILDRGV